MSRILTLALIVTISGVTASSGGLVAQTVPGYGQEASRQIVGEKYIVVFEDRVADPARMANDLTRQHGASPRFVYQHAIKGFAVTLPPQAAHALSQNPNVAYVEPDAPVQLFDVQPNPPNWGLDRIDQTDLPLDNSFTYGNDASGVNVYIIDSGIRKAHNDFGGRVEYVPSDSSGNFVGDGHGSAEDCFGHGTHVAGVAASASYGVAKSATIWAARVTDCAGNGDASMALAAVDWITGNGLRPGVVNMSLGYLNAQSLHDGVETSIALGFTYVVAAGNQIVPGDACIITPANVAGALTVGATEIDDDEATFSNYGTCVDMLAPGVNILSTWYTGNSATQNSSGTSAASPHVAGAAALYLCANPSALPSQVASALTGNATAGRINLHSFSQGVTPNLLLDMSFIGVCTPPPPNFAPTVASAIPDTTVNEDSAPVAPYRDLNDVFADFEDGDSLAFVVVSNTNPSVVTAAIDVADSTLDLSFGADQNGSATIVIRATDSGALTVNDTFLVTVTPVNDAPVVSTAMPDTTVTENSDPIENYRDLNDVFTDVEDGQALGFAVASNSNPTLVTAVIDADSALDLSFAPLQSGSAELVIRATDLGALTVDDTLVVTVTPVND
ncbi:MAG: S8 family serine peptidase, partial [Candidatus Krumholzibacteria bacterium]|nr:S8 family serine peptidase [Candidatus Krumholzibacteria bacterium]